MLQKVGCKKDSHLFWESVWRNDNVPNFGLIVVRGLFSSLVPSGSSLSVPFPSVPFPSVPFPSVLLPLPSVLSFLSVMYKILNGLCPNIMQKISTAKNYCCNTRNPPIHSPRNAETDMDYRPSLTWFQKFAFL